MSKVDWIDFFPFIKKLNLLLFKNNKKVEKSEFISNNDNYKQDKKDNVNKGKNYYGKKRRRNYSDYC
tara:strand:- start:1110 stop:1310 length:201 start_codon:yes stop_codon:yes gene_type:complete